MLTQFYKLPFLLKWGMVATFCFSLLPSFAQSGWVKPKGELYSKLSLGAFASSKYYNLNGDLLNTAQFRQLSLGLYGEYGLTDRIDVIINWSSFKAQGFETTSTVAGIGDLGLGIKYGVLKGVVPVSVTIMPDLPIGARNLFAQNKEIAFERINLPTGDGEFNLHTTVAASYGFGSLPFYLNLFGDYNFRTGFAGNDFRDQWTAGLEFGWQFHPDFWIKGDIQVQETIGMPTQLTDFIRSDGTSFTGYGFGLFYKLNDNWGLDVNYRNFTDLIVPRRNLYSAGFMSAGLIYELK